MRACLVAITLAAGLFGCSSEKPVQKTVQSQSPVTSIRVIALDEESADDGLNHGVYKLFPSINGEWIAMDRAFDFGKTQAQIETVNFLRLSQDLKILSRTSLPESQQVSNLAPLGNGKFQFLVENNLSYNQNGLHVRLTLYEWTPAENAPDPLVTKYLNFTAPAIENGQILYSEKARTLREDTVEVFKENFMQSSPDREPFLWDVQSGGHYHVFINQILQAGVFTPEYGGFRALRPVTGGPGPSLKATADENGRAIFAGSFSREELKDLAPLYPALHLQSLPKTNSNWILITRELKDGNFRPQIFPSQNKGRVTVDAILNQGAKLIAVGSARSADKTSMGWIGILENSILTEQTFVIDGHTFISAIEASPNGYFVGGSTSFNQVTGPGGGSVSNMQGYVGLFSKNLKLIDTIRLEGARTTRVLALHPLREGVLIGGKTDAASTHDGNESANSFVATWFPNQAKGMEK